MATSKAGPTKAEKGKLDQQISDLAQQIEQLQTGAVNIYADSMLQISVGGFVSKVLVGAFNATNGDTPRVANLAVIAMPTRALLDMAINILTMFSGDGLADNFNRDYQALEQAIARAQKIKVSNVG